MDRDTNEATRNVRKRRHAWSALRLSLALVAPIASCSPGIVGPEPPPTGKADPSASAPTSSVRTDAPATSVATSGQPLTGLVMYLDTERVLAEVAEGLEAHEKLKKEQERRQPEIAKRELSLKILGEQLQKLVKGGPQALLEKKAAEYQQAEVEYQQLISRFNKELADKEREFYDPIEKRVKDLTRVIASREGYDAILGKRAVPFVRPELDMTPSFIREYDKAYPGKPAAAASGASSSKPPPPPAPSASAPPKAKG